MTTTNSDFAKREAALLSKIEHCSLAHGPTMKKLWDVSRIKNPKAYDFVKLAAACEARAKTLETTKSSAKEDENNLPIRNLIVENRKLLVKHLTNLASIFNNNASSNNSDQNDNYEPKSPESECKKIIELKLKDDEECNDVKSVTFDGIDGAEGHEQHSENSDQGENGINKPNESYQQDLAFYWEPDSDPESGDGSDYDEVIDVSPIKNLFSDEESGSVIPLTESECNFAESIEQLTNLTKVQNYKHDPNDSVAEFQVRYISIDPNNKENPNKIYAHGLLTCAAVVILCPETKKAAVLHASGGHVNETEIKIILSELKGKNEAAKVIIAYAYANDPSDTYSNNIRRLKESCQSSVKEIQLHNGWFGINSLGQVIGAKASEVRTH